MRPISSLETEYLGIRFRSRLEARWAVFFDRMGIDWSYEPGWYLLPVRGAYKPDFYLPKYEGGVLAEVKPEGGDFGKARELATTGVHVMLLDGAPALRRYTRCGIYETGYAEMAVWFDDEAFDDDRYVRAVDVANASHLWRDGMLKNRKCEFCTDIHRCETSEEIVEETTDPLDPQKNPFDGWNEGDPCFVEGRKGVFLFHVCAPSKHGAGWVVKVTHETGGRWEWVDSGKVCRA